MSRLRPFFSYYGSKWRLAPKYPAPKFDTIIEAFAGSATYALLYPDHKVILNDLNPRISALWRYLIKSTPDEILSIPLIKNEEELNQLSDEQKILVGFWWGKGLTEPARKPTGWLKDNNPEYDYQYWGEKRRERIANQVEFIKHWKVLETPYQKLLNLKATWFIDPPYDNTPGEGYTYGRKQINYSVLGDWCLDRKGQLIVCENMGAQWLPFIPLAKVKTTRDKLSHEAYYTNDC